MSGPRSQLGSAAAGLRRSCLTLRVLLFGLLLVPLLALAELYWPRLPDEAELSAAAEAFRDSELRQLAGGMCVTDARAGPAKIVRLTHQTDLQLRLAHLTVSFTLLEQPWNFRAKACDDTLPSNERTFEVYAVLNYDAATGRFVFMPSLSEVAIYQLSMRTGWDAQPPPAPQTSGPGRYRAIIQIPPLTPGEVLSPSVDVVDENGKPPGSSIYVSWLINGVNTPSVLWDGSETRVEVQVSVDNQAVVAAVVIPAAGDAPVSAAPASSTPSDPGAGMPEGPLPGMSGAGPLPGPGSLGQALIGSLLPPLMIAIGQLLGGIRGGRSLPQGPVPPAPKPPAPTLPASKQPKPSALNPPRPTMHG